MSWKQGLRILSYPSVPITDAHPTQMISNEESIASTSSGVVVEKNSVCPIIPSIQTEEKVPAKTEATSSETCTTAASPTCAAVAPPAPPPPLSLPTTTKMTASQSSKIISSPPSSVTASTTNSTAQQQKQPTKSSSSGRWSREEHEQFLEGLKIYGREWKKVALRIPTRTSAQIRSHAQKYFAKLAREEQQRTATAAATAAAASSNDGDIYDQHHIQLGAAGGVTVGPDQHSLLLSQVTHVQLTTSAMAKVGRILEDPERVQHEVEDTLAALRRRYDLLQNRLHRGNPLRGGGGGGSGHGGAGTGAVAHRATKYSVKERLLAAEQDTTSRTGSEIGSARKKRRIGEVVMGPPPTVDQQLHQQQEEQREQILENRDLWSQELIALSVLGGSLGRRSASRENLTETTTNNDAQDASMADAAKKSSADDDKDIKK